MTIYFREMAGGKRIPRKRNTSGHRNLWHGHTCIQHLWVLPFKSGQGTLCPWH